MKLPVQFFEVIRSKVLVSNVIRQKLSLQRKADEFLGICPFHHEKTPSFTVNDHKRFFHCFGCGAHGDVIKFVAETDGISYTDAAIKLANDNGIELPRLSPLQQKQYEEIEQVLYALKLAAAFYHQNLLNELKQNEELKQYLQRRALTPEVVLEFQLGYAGNSSIMSALEQYKIPTEIALKAGLINKRDNGTFYDVFKNRLIFPIINLYGKIIGYGGRTILDIQPKYLNSAETIVFKKGENFYNENKAFSSAYKLGYMLVVEGYMDLITVSCSGFSNVVASLGTAVTKDHLEKLWRSIDEIVLCFDGDKAGLNAMHRALHLALPLIKAEQRLSVILLPHGSDPDDFIKAKGKEEFAKLVNNRIPLSEAIWYIETWERSFSHPEDKAALEHKLDTYIAEATDQALARSLKAYYKNKLWQLNWYKPGASPKTKSKITHNSGLPRNYSEEEMLLLSLLALIVEGPLLRLEENLEMLASIEIENSELAEWKYAILEMIAQNKDAEASDLRALTKDTSLLGIFRVLSLARPDNISTESAEKYDIAWQLLTKQYQLFQLQKEYNQIINSGEESAIEKSLLYQQEIIALQGEIARLRRT